MRRNLSLRRPVQRVTWLNYMTRAAGNAMGVSARCVVGLLLLALLVLAECSRQPLYGSDAVDRRHKKKKKNPYSSPEGMFIQVCGSDVSSVLPILRCATS